MTDPRGSNPTIKQDAEAKPHPPRFWWLKRLSLAGLLLIVALAGLRWWWGHEAQRRIDALVADAHAKGEPILPEDFDSPPVPDDQNAAIPLKQAETMPDLNAPEWAFQRSISETLPLSTADASTLQRILQNHKVELQLLRSARRLPAAGWRLQIRSPEIWSRFAYADVRLALLLRWSVLYEHSRGNDAAAIEYFRDMVTLAKVCGCRPQAHDAVSISVSRNAIAVALSHHEMAANSIRGLLPSLVINESDSTASKIPASAEQIRGLIADLVDERHVRDAVVQAFLGKRTGDLISAREIAKDQISFQPLADLALPIFELRCVERAHRASAAIEAAREDDYSHALSRLPSPERDEAISSLQWLAHGGQDDRNTADTPRFQEVYRVIVERRVTATSLALHLYARDHAGKLPETLKELVPRYLPMVPSDPLAPDSRPLGYLPHRDPPVLYSVGFNGIDDGAPLKSPLNATWNPRDHWTNEEDAVFFIRPSLK
ncbi:MAG: hypothetical protein JWN24_444 [Phycisphaerales bacterium]|nr:hypothetical protein [Phycisphaerales bacterium]